MGFMKHFRSVSRMKEKDRFKDGTPSSLSSALGHVHSPGPDFTRKLDSPELKPILRNIFSHVCPHALDDRHEVIEKSVLPDGCMLCDLRDLSKCALVKKSWYGPATELQYKNIRIDAVHYCELEGILGDKRKGKLAYDRDGKQIDIPTVRLQLLCRTVRENSNVAFLVQIIKLPYMTREACKADLARTVSVLPNLRYVDLPEGFFSANDSTYFLRTELQARCPDIRKMKFAAGAEHSFELLARGLWQNLEVIELSGLRIEPATLRRILPSSRALHDLKLTGIIWFNDVLFQQTPSFPNFPPLRKLSLEGMQQITAAGLGAYLSRPENAAALSYLELKNTGVAIASLHSVLAAATNLEELAVVEEVSHSLMLNGVPLPPLASSSLKIFYYEISLAGNANRNPYSLEDPVASYYAYLSNSLHANALPSLRELYVRDTSFPDLLLLTPPLPAFSSAPPAVPAFTTHALEIYTKGPDDLEWAFASLTPPTGGTPFPARANALASALPSIRDSVSGNTIFGRPVSAHGTSASKGLSNQWGSEARRSIVIGDGVGGFLAVPVPPEAQAQRPKSMGGYGASHSRSHSTGNENKKKGSSNRHDLWR